jgi:O-antigen/teichoic acid export membrane protein
VFNIPSEYISDVRWCLILFGLELIIAFPGANFDAILEAHGRFDILCLTSIVFQLAGAIVTVILLMMGFYIKALILNEICFSIIGIAVDLVIVKRVLPHISIKPRIHKKSMKILFGFSLWAFLLDLFEEGGAEIESFVIPILFPVALLTPYSIAVTLSSVLVLGVQPIIDVLFPLSSGFNAKENLEALQCHAINGAKAASAISIPLLLIFLLFGQSIIKEIFLMLIISCSYYSTCWLACPVSMLVGMGKFKRLLYSSIIEGTILLAIIFSLYRKLGIYSIAIGFATSNILTNFAIVLPYISTVLKLNPLRFLHETMMKPLLPAICVLLGLSGYKLLFDTPSVLLLFSNCILAVCGYAVLFLFISNSREERASIYKTGSTLLLNFKGLLKGSGNV